MRVGVLEAIAVRCLVEFLRGRLVSARLDCQSRFGLFRREKREHKHDKCEQVERKTHLKDKSENVATFEIPPNQVCRDPSGTPEVIK